MSKYISFTDKQKQRANSIDLVDFLRAQGQNKGGLAIDFVRKFFNLEFPDAVTMLLNGKHDAGFAEADAQSCRSLRRITAGHDAWSE